MSKKILTAIIGAGSQAHNWARALDIHNNYNLEFVNSRNKTLGENFSKKYDCKYEQDENKLAKNPNIDLVIFSTNSERQKKCINFANQKKNLILEKPLALEKKSAEEIYNACINNKIKCGAGLNRHYDTFIPKIKYYLNKYSWICHSVDYRSFLKSDNYNEEFSMEKIKKKGDLVLGGLVHKFDQINSIFGSPEKLIAKKMNTTENDILTQIQVSVEYKGNLLVNFMINNNCMDHYGEEIIFYCDKGVIHVNFNLETVSVISNFLNDRISRSILSRFKSNLLKGVFFKFKNKKFLDSYNFRVGGQKDILDSFSDRYFLNNKTDLVNVDNNYFSTKMAFACYESIKQDKWVSI